MAAVTRRQHATGAHTPAPSHIAISPPFAADDLLSRQNADLSIRTMAAHMSDPLKHPSVPWLWTNGTCHRPHTSLTNVRRMQWHHNIHKTSWNHCHHLNSASVQRKRLPFRTNGWHSPRCLRCLNPACDRITYTGDYRGPKPLKWHNCRRTLRRVQCTNPTNSEWGGCPPQWSGLPRTQRGSAQVQGLLRKGFPGFS